MALESGPVRRIRCGLNKVIASEDSVYLPLYKRSFSFVHSIKVKVKVKVKASISD